MQRQERAALKVRCVAFWIVLWQMLQKMPLMIREKHKGKHIFAKRNERIDFYLGLINKNWIYRLNQHLHGHKMEMFVKRSIKNEK